MTELDAEILPPDRLLGFMGVNDKGIGDHHRVLSAINRDKVRPSGIHEPKEISSDPIAIAEGRKEFIDSYVASIKNLKLVMADAWATDVRPRADGKKEYAHYEVTYIPT